jgi:hypothetical protein
MSSFSLALKVTFLGIGFIISFYIAWATFLGIKKLRCTKIIYNLLNNFNARLRLKQFLLIAGFSLLFAIQYYYKFSFLAIRYKILIYPM